MRTSIAIACLALSIGTLLPTLAQDIDDNQVPGPCRSVCQPVTALTQSCDRAGDNNNDNNSDNDNDDDDNNNNDGNGGNDGDSYINCICRGNNAATDVPLCAACIASNERDDDNDVYDIVRTCSFSTTTYAASSTGSMSMTMSSTGSMTSMPSSTSASATAVSNTDNDDDCDKGDDGDDDCRTTSSATPATVSPTPTPTNAAAALFEMNGQALYYVAGGLAAAVIRQGL